MDGSLGDEDALVQQAIAESMAVEGQVEQSGFDEELQRALIESVSGKENRGLRPLMGPDGPFLPAGLLNSGNSCFWNALVQALFFATPVFRGALFQLELSEETSVLRALRDLFAELDMGLESAIDAGKLYRMIFHQAEEADVSEQMFHLFRIASKGPNSLKAVWRELFSGDLYEENLQAGQIHQRVTHLDLCQLELCVTKPMSLPQLLEEHAQDVQGSIQRRSYRLPPVLWLNLDRFAYDRVAQRGKKRQVKVAFPDKLNTWMLAPLNAPWAKRLHVCAETRRSILQELTANRRALDAAAKAAPRQMSEPLEQDLIVMAEHQEALVRRLNEVDEHLEQLGEEQDLVYDLRAVIVHKGVVDSGHYFAYARCPRGSTWCCLNDSSVSLCEGWEMRRVAEGTTFDDEGDDVEMGTEELASEENGLEGLGKALPEHEGLPCSPSGQEGAPNGGLWHWLPSSFVGCMPAGTRSNSEDFQAPPNMADACPPLSSAPALPAPKSSSSPKSPQPLNQGSTEARCLVYVRRGASDSDKLLDEVRQRIPAQLQEQIDVCNQKVLSTAIEDIVSDVASCLQGLQGGAGGEGSHAPEAILRTAEWVRTEAGMSMARAYTLRACWRLHIPWLPEELCPTALPPDFRMYYGRAARQLLLDALIRQGQHDIASLAASGESDAFTPREMQDWLIERGL